MKIQPDIAAAVLAIATAKERYRTETGLVPNLLLIGANTPDAISDNVTMLGMRVIVDDALRVDYAVAYLL